MFFFLVACGSDASVHFCRSALRAAGFLLWILEMSVGDEAAGHGRAFGNDIPLLLFCHYSSIVFVLDLIFGWHGVLVLA